MIGNFKMTKESKDKHLMNLLYLLFINHCATIKYFKNTNKSRTCDIGVAYRYGTDICKFYHFINLISLTYLIFFFK